MKMCLDTRQLCQGTTIWFLLRNLSQTAYHKIITSGEDQKTCVVYWIYHSFPKQASEIKKSNVYGYHLFVYIQCILHLNIAC